MLLFIIRHGDPIYNPDSLTELGHKQAEALAERFAIHGLDEIYSSPNGRVRQTAQPTCTRLGLEYKVEPWMSEDLTWEDLSLVNAEGRRIWSFAIQESLLLSDDKSLSDEWYDSVYFRETNAKAGYERVQRESDAFFAKLGYVREGRIYRIVEKNEKRVAVFCHQGLGLTWLSHILGIHPVRFWADFDISHSGVTVINMNNYPNGFTAPQCLSFSDLSHIHKGELPYMFQNRIPL